MTMPETFPLLQAPPNAEQFVRDRRDKLAAHRRLTARWICAAGPEHPELAEISLAVMRGETYEDACKAAAPIREVSMT